MHLLSNAIKYNRLEGEVVASISADREQVSIATRGTGRGLCGEQIGALFQPCHRLDAEVTGTDDSGIGLVIVKQLVDDINGQVQVASTPG